LFDTASIYGDGLSETILGQFLQKQRAKNVFLSKTFARTSKNAISDLQQSLRNLRTDYLDLWLIHDLRTERDWNESTASHGTMQAFLRAKREGSVRWIGFHSQRNPSLALKVMNEFLFDVILIPQITSYESVVQQALRRNIGILEYPVYPLTTEDFRCSMKSIPVIIDCSQFVKKLI
jgi:aryl-alcohol dehydrogenase-like predicted oxidoreductase